MSRAMARIASATITMPAVSSHGAMTGLT